VATQIPGTPADERFEAAVTTLKLLADETRLRVIWSLLHGEHTVGELADHVGARASTVSQHLAKLRLAKLVRTRRDGTRVHYSAANDHIERLVSEALLHVDHHDHVRADPVEAGPA
jgi:ArsR family transcriptional regulator